MVMAIWGSECHLCLNVGFFFWAWGIFCLNVVEWISCTFGVYFTSLVGSQVWSSLDIVVMIICFLLVGVYMYYFSSHLHPDSLSSAFLSPLSMLPTILFFSCDFIAAVAHGLFLESVFQLIPGTPLGLALWSSISVLLSVYLFCCPCHLWMWLQVKGISSSAGRVSRSVTLSTVCHTHPVTCRQHHSDS